jgi:hypothetical protein
MKGAAHYARVSCAKQQLNENIASQIAATAQRLAAVVNPRITSRLKMIVPAPKNPIPLTTWAAIREGSRITFRSLNTSANPKAETSMNNVAPTHTSMWAPNPAAQSNRSRSKPMTLPSNADRNSRKMISRKLSMGLLCSLIYLSILISLPSLRFWAIRKSGNAIERQSIRQDSNSKFYSIWPGDLVSDHYGD